MTSGDRDILRQVLGLEFDLDRIEWFTEIVNLLASADVDEALAGALGAIGEGLERHQRSAREKWNTLLAALQRESDGGKTAEPQT